jgi:hypothetical protein
LACGLSCLWTIVVLGKLGGYPRRVMPLPGLRI